MTFFRVKDERLDGVNQVKMENQLDIEVKSEKADIESMMSVNMDSLTPNEELNIKPEYDDDYVISDLGWDRIKVEEKLESGIEVDSAGGAVDQLKMEFQDSETVEEKPDSSGTHFEYIDALGLHEDFDIKTEIDESDEHDSATNSAQIRKKRKGGGKKLQGNRVIEKHDPANTVQKAVLESDEGSSRRRSVLPEFSRTNTRAKNSNRLVLSPET
ncbi:unnamed protein product [Acanthoscelides obtectus]|uniref:Uncharacterized protein n=1 Tax=Acanthoscelides obtectus TaxID=200917 RepID=A0A9P0KVT3_ACAOB|nr:unnamed protein product [Acanthoscelides obtectus]CAK1676178.1 hypothetical protein AOBTE_LOCUS30633 [Acanthoscelides obtectus]